MYWSFHAPRDSFCLLWYSWVRYCNFPFVHAVLCQFSVPCYAGFIKTSWKLSFFMLCSYWNSHGIIYSLKIWQNLPVKLSGCDPFRERSSFKNFLKMLLISLLRLSIFFWFSLGHLFSKLLRIEQSVLPQFF